MHAKVSYALDKREALYGSCNLTDAGFGKNIEVGSIVSNEYCDELDHWIQRERARTKVVDLQSFLACVDLTKDAVRIAAEQEAEGSPAQESDLDVAVDLFEKELLKSIPDRRVTSPKELARFRVGSRVHPTSADVVNLLPSGWPSYEEFLAYLKDLKNPEATTLRKRALGIDGHNLSGHAKHFFWGMLFFFMESPNIAREIDPGTFLEDQVFWGAVSWRREWLQFLDLHEDENYPSIGVWFHTIRTYLPPTFGGGSATGGAGSGNLKRTVAFLSRMLRDRRLL